MVSPPKNRISHNPIPVDGIFPPPLRGRVREGGANNGLSSELLPPTPPSPARGEGEESKKQASEYSPFRISPLLRLMRLNQPVGIWLLFFPCAWALVLASGGLPEPSQLVLFALGAVAMRSAGCIINDIADRDIDKLVERTKNRPLASGEVSVRQASFLLLALLIASLVIATQLGWVVVLWGALALLPVAIYPLMKRVSWWPQLFLGLCFNWGALMGWAAVRETIELPAIFLYIGGICWTLGYDTIYAHQDKTDDAKIGVRSTALRLGEQTKPFVAVMYALAILFFALASESLLCAAALLPAACHAAWQVAYLDINSPASAKKIFLSNVWFGALVCFALFFN